MGSLVDVVKAVGPFGLIMLVPIVAIICQAWVQVRRMQMRHAERLAMIQRGLDPGVIGEGDDKADDVAKPGASPH